MTNNNNSHSFRNPRLGLGLRRILLTSASAALMLMAAGQRAEAAPLFYSLEAGDASVTVNGTTTRIDQTSDRAVINWTSFNVSAAETVTFQVPSSDGATLNRIVGGASSTISGTINSNGTVFFVNPNGLVFNGTTQQAINVGSFIAYTGAVNTNDFMRQQPLFMETPTSSTTPSISISTPINIPSGGFVGLYGPQVSVSGRVTIAGGSMEVVSYNRNLTLGMVTNKGGEVRLTSGGNITLNGVFDLASGVLSLVSTAPSSRVSTSGNDGNGTISNTSDVIADRVSITSSGQGSVSLNNVHIARLGEVNLSTPQGDKLFSLTNRRDLTVDGAITLYGALVLRTVDSTSFGITISSAITVNQIQSAASNPINTSANLLSLNINSAGSLTTSGDISVSGDATVTASDDITIGANLVAMPQKGTGDPTRGSLTIASTNGGLVTTGTTVGLKSLTVSAATGIALGSLGSKGDIRITKSCTVTGCTQIAGDITLNGSVIDYDYPEAVVSAKVQNLSITNSYGDIVLNQAIEVDKNITIEATNGSVTQTNSHYGLLSRNGKINLRSTSSNDSVGIRVSNLEAQTVFTDARGTAVVTAMRDAIVLESDSDIVVETGFSSTATGQLSALRSDFGSVKLTSTNGNISVLGEIATTISRFGFVSDIVLNAANGGITVDGAINGLVDYSSITGSLAAARNIAGVTVRLASGLDGVEINGIVTAVGSVTIRADSNGSVYFGSSASVTSDSIQQYGNLTDLNVLFSATTANESRGNIIIVGRNLLTQSSVTFSADNQISATMSGNITIGEDNTIASDILISTPALGSIFTDQSVILTSSGSNKRVSIGSGTSIDGDSITLQGGIVTVAGFLTSYGATDALGSIKINSTSGNINFSTATITSAQSITLSSSGSVIGGGSTFSATGTVGGFTINNFGASINGSVSLSSSSITAKLVQVDAHGAVAMDGSNQIDKLAYIKSNGGDISLSTGSDLAIAGGETLTTGNTVRTITLNVGGTMSLLGNVTLRGDVVTVTANELRAAPGAPATTLGLYYYNVNRNFTYNGTQPTMILSTTPSAVLVKRID